MGKSFGAFEGDGEVPAYIEQLDNAYIVFSLYSLSPSLCGLLRLLPVKGLREFLAAKENVYKVGLCDDHFSLGPQIPHVSTLEQ